MKSSPLTWTGFWLCLIVLAGMVLDAEATVTNVAWYRLGENDPGATSGQVVNATTTNFVGTNELKRFGSPQYTSSVSTDAKAIGSTLGVVFDGSTQFYSNAVVTTARNNFGIEAWVRTVNAPAGLYVIAHNGRFAANGWGLSVQVTNVPFLGLIPIYFGELGGGIRVGAASLRAGGWAHVAFVRDNGTSTFYFNGVASGNTTNITPATPSTGFAIAATPESAHSGFLPGIVDEVRVFTFAPGQFSTNDLLANVRRAVTLEASDLTATTARLNGSANSVSLPTTGWFEWGTDPTNLVNSTSPQFLGSNFNTMDFSETVTGLTAGVTYYFRAVATNDLGAARGGFKSFIIGPTTRVWTGNAGEEWSVGANWLPAQGAQSGDTLIFPGNAANFISSNDIPGITIDSIQIFGPINLLGLNITVSNGISSASSTSATIGCPVSLASDQQFSGDVSDLRFTGGIVLNRHNLSFNAIGNNGARIVVPINILGIGNIVKIGAGSMVWQGAENSFTGTLRVEDGLMIFDKPAGFNNVVTRLEIAGPGRVQLQQPDQIFNLCQVQIETGGQLLLNGQRELLSTNIVMWDDAVIDGGGNYASSGLTLRAGVKARTTNSIAVIRNGRITLDDTNIVFELDGRQGCCTGTGFLDVSANISGAPGFSTAGTGTLRLSGTNSFLGRVIIQQITVIAAHPSAFGLTNGTVELRNAGSLKLSNAHVGEETLEVFDSSFSDVDDSGQNTRGAGVFIEGTNSWAGPIILHTNLFFYGGSADMTFSGPISGTGGLWFYYGAYHFEGAPTNTYSGATFARCRLLTLNRIADHFAIAGPLSVGTENSPSSRQLEVRWLNSRQLPPTTALNIRTNGFANLNQNQQDIGSIFFNGGRIDTGPSPGLLGVSQQIVSNATNQTARIEGFMRLLGPIDFIAGDGPVDPDLWINARINDTLNNPSTDINKLGNGELLLSAQNFLRSMVVRAGILEVEHDSAVGFVNTLEGATLELENLSVNFRSFFQVSGAGRGGTNGALYSRFGATDGGGFRLAGPTTIRVDSTSLSLFIDSGIEGIGPLIKTGPGLLTFAGSAPNIYSGETFVNQGRLTLQKPGGTAAVPADLTIGTSDGLAADVIYQQEFLVVGNVTVNHNAVLNLNNFTEDFGLPTSGGRPPLTLNGGGSVQTGPSGNIYLPRGGDVVVNPGLTFVNASSVISGNIGLDEGPHHFTVGNAFHLGRFLPELEISAVISARGAPPDIVKDGPGEMRLDRANTYTGTTTINDGTLTVSNNLSLGTSAGGTIVNGNGSLALDGGGLVIASEPLTMNSSNASALHILSGVSNTWSGPITLSRDTSIDVSPNPNPSGTFQVFSSISGPGGITKRGPGRLVFSGSSGNGYTGLTTVAQGVLLAERTLGGSLRDLLIASGANLVTEKGSSFGQFFSFSRVTVQSGGLWQMNSTNETIRALFGGGTVNIPTTNTLTVNNDINCEFSGSFSGGGHLLKNSAGTLLLSGNSPSFNGQTIVMFGDCKVDGSMINSPFLVTSGHLVGDGVVGNLTSSNNGALLRPDSKFADHQGADIEVGNLTLPTQNGGAGCTVQLEFFGPSSIGGNDSIIARGNVTLGGAVLAPFFRYAPHEGDEITLIDKRSSGAISGTFLGIAQNSVVVVNGIECHFSYTSGDGNDAAMTVTNLPLSFADVVVFSGNGNDTIENDECVLVNVSLRNKRFAPLTPTNVQLRVLSPNVMVTMGESSYAPIPAGGVMFNSTPFQLRSTREFVCGKKVSLEIQVSVFREGTFAIPFAIPASTTCGSGGGACESCTVVSGQFKTNTPTMASRPYFVGDVSSCFPTKACPGADPDTNLPPVRFLTHNFTNTTTRELCVTVQPHYDCFPQPTPVNALGVSAYLGAFDPNQLCTGYLGDGGVGGGLSYPSFSFRVPAGSNFVVVVVARNILCSDYTLELFGLPCPPPTVEIASGASLDPVVVQWSSAYPDYNLQSVASLDGPGPYPFAPVADQRVLLNGKYTVTNTPSGPRQFFRLAK